MQNEISLKSSGERRDIAQAALDVARADAATAARRLNEAKTAYDAALAAYDASPTVENQNAAALRVVARDLEIDRYKRSEDRVREAEAALASVERDLAADNASARASAAKERLAAALMARNGVLEDYMSARAPIPRDGLSKVERFAIDAYDEAIAAAGALAQLRPSEASRVSTLVADRSTFLASLSGPKRFHALAERGAALVRNGAWFMSQGLAIIESELAAANEAASLARERGVDAPDVDRMHILAPALSAMTGAFPDIFPRAAMARLLVSVATSEGGASAAHPLLWIVSRWSKFLEAFTRGATWPTYEPEADATALAELEALLSHASVRSGREAVYTARSAAPTPGHDTVSGGAS